MSRQLPSVPNLEHLRKQAKDLLPGLRARDPEAKLADAQQAIAAEYGFMHWPALKAHVDAHAAAADLAAREHALAGSWIAVPAAAARDCARGRRGRNR